MIQKALMIAYFAHQNQKDKAGCPYFLHPFYVALQLNGVDEKTVALLHDVVEDTEITLDDLKKEGFPDNIIVALDAITRRDESYDSYIKRVKANNLAKAVKIEDLKHNLDETRIQNPTEKDKKRFEKYKKALIYLLE